MTPHDRFGDLFIVGAGAIGSLIAAGFSHSEIAYQWILREKTLPPDAVKTLRYGEISLLNKQWQRGKFSASDIIVLPLKAYQIADALKLLQPLLHPSTVVILIHNGMGGAEVAREVLGPLQPTYLATTSQAALKKAATRVEHTGLGDTYVGMSWLCKATNKSDDIANLLEQTLAPTFVATDMKAALWKKLIINAAINPLTALHSIRNGELEQTQYRETITRVCEEACAVAKCEDILLDSIEMVETVLRVAKDTAQNYSSMNRDVHARRQTEIDSISGYIVEIANKKGIHVPVNALLYESIKQCAI